jgi:endonuclease/exonuclease/phosphatase family metal-dependent hydrolase
MASSRDDPSKLRKIALLLERLRPDIVALQEVDEDSHWNGRLNLLAYLQEHTRLGDRRGLTYEGVYGFGFGTWDFVEDDQEESAMLTLSEAVQRVVDLAAQVSNIK